MMPAQQAKSTLGKYHGVWFLAIKRFFDRYCSNIDIM